jgi:elongation factor G
MLLLETIRNQAEGEGKRLRAASPDLYEYAHVKVRVEPLPRGAGVKIEPIQIQDFPVKFFPSVEQGILRVIATGVFARCEMTDVKVEVTGGSYHEIDSTADAFEQAAIIATRKAMLAAEPYLLEPVSTLTVKTPEEFMGAVLGSINQKRGRIEKVEHSSPERALVITASVPHTELSTLMADMDYVSMRRVTCTNIHAGYEALPSTVAGMLIQTCPHCRERVIPTHPERTCPNCGRRIDSSEGPMVAE